MASRRCIIAYNMSLTVLPKPVSNWEFIAVEEPEIFDTKLSPLEVVLDPGFPASNWINQSGRLGTPEINQPTILIDLLICI
ncbi:hypothetical protein GUJ93_ZPchr0016g2600 [Zizania palustris]|uniref:Uncharacterized protein n=1 Tax=Zizania palustris TaxID=103762 RepID=A0A8J5TBH0_ZIZPA|nr:hypothetical protein GUJ93_ZPchr0016g2600 [Zizania palustris]